MPKSRKPVRYGGSIALPFPMVRCRTRLLPSGSKGRFCRVRPLIFITAICGVQLFAPYQGFGLRTARPPSPREPGHPLLRDDPDHIRQVAAAFTTALLDGQEPKPSRFSDGILNHPATDPGPRRDLVDRPVAAPVLAHLVPDNAENRQLADRELARERRRHRPGGREVPSPSNRD